MGGSIIALSYEAKNLGVTRGHKGDEAKEICPDIELVTVPVKYEKADLTKYRNAGNQVFDLCSKFVSNSKCLKASIDEAYLDISQAAYAMRQEESSENLTCQQVFEKHQINIEETKIIGYDAVVDFFSRRVDQLAEDESLVFYGSLIVAKMRRHVNQTLGFTLSAGISHNKLLAKLVSGLFKPNRQTILLASSVSTFLSTLPLNKMNGFKRKLGDFLGSSLGVKFVGDLQKYSLTQLQEMLPGGQTAEWVFDSCHGFCDSEIEDRMTTKAVSSGKTFRGPNALKKWEDVFEYLQFLSQEILERVSELEKGHRLRPTNFTISWATSSGSAKSRTIRIPSKMEVKSFADTALHILEKNIDIKEPGSSIISMFLSCGNMIEGVNEKNTIQRLFQNKQNNFVEYINENETQSSISLGPIPSKKQRTERTAFFKVPKRTFNASSCGEVINLLSDED